MNDNLERAYDLIHDTLPDLPEKYCHWKKRGVGGRLLTKTLSGDYRPMFSFLYNPILRNNLAELRMCVDYHLSLYDLHKPGLTFGWQHKLVICQLIAEIFEGLLLDLFEYLTTKKEKSSISIVLANEKLNNKNFGFGALIDIFSKAELIETNWQNYLKDLNYIRNTVHPKSLNSKNVSYENNPIIKEKIDKQCERLDDFLIKWGKFYI